MKKETIINTLWILIVFIFGILIGITIPEKEQIPVRDIFGDGLLLFYGDNTYKITEPIKTLNVTTRFNNNPYPTKIELYTKDFELIESYNNISNRLFTPEIEDKYYGKITTTVYFEEEGVSETRYAWVLFESNPDIKLNSSEIKVFSLVLAYDPAIWREEPATIWE